MFTKLVITSEGRFYYDIQVWSSRGRLGLCIVSIYFIIVVFDSSVSVEVFILFIKRPDLYHLFLFLFSTDLTSRRPDPGSTSFSTDLEIEHPTDLEIGHPMFLDFYIPITRSEWPGPYPKGTSPFLKLWLTLHRPGPNTKYTSSHYCFHPHPYTSEGRSWISVWSVQEPRRRRRQRNFLVSGLVVVLWSGTCLRSTDPTSTGVFNLTPNSLNSPKGIISMY